MIDESIRSQGVVAVYVRIPTTFGETAVPLPWVMHITRGSPQMLNFEIDPGEIVVNFFDLVDDSVDPGIFGSKVEHGTSSSPGERRRWVAYSISI